MAINVGALLRSLVMRGVADGESYNDLYHQVADAGIHVPSSVFAREWRYAVGLEQNTIDMRGRAGEHNRDIVPTSEVITEGPVAWPDRFNARVQVFGQDLETGRFGHRWLNVGYGRLPTFGSIADTAMVLAIQGEGHYDFRAQSVAAITVESSSSPRL